MIFALTIAKHLCTHEGINKFTAELIELNSFLMVKIMIIKCARIFSLFRHLVEHWIVIWLLLWRTSLDSSIAIRFTCLMVIGLFAIRFSGNRKDFFGKKDSDLVLAHIFYWIKGSKFWIIEICLYCVKNTILVIHLIPDK